MFMKAILHNREDDLHFLLKCLIEELQDKAILKYNPVQMIVMNNLTPEQRKKAEAYFESVRLHEEQKRKEKEFKQSPYLDPVRLKVLERERKARQKRQNEALKLWSKEKAKFDAKKKKNIDEFEERRLEVIRRKARKGKPFFQPTSPEESDFEAISPKRLLGIYSGKDTVAELETLKDNPEVKRVLDTMSKKTIRLQRKGKRLSDKQIKTQLDRLASGKESPKGMKDTTGYGKIKDTYIKIYNQLVTALNKTKKENPEKGKKIQDFIDMLANRKEVVDNKLFADKRKEQEVSESTPKFFDFLLKNLEEVKENLEKGGKTGASNKLRTMFKNTNYDNPQFIMDGINIVLNRMKPKEESPKTKPEESSLSEDKYPKRELFGRKVFDKERIRGKRAGSGVLSDASRRRREAERKKLQFKKQDTGEMFRYFDAKKVKGKWMWDARDSPLADGEKGVNTLKAVIDGLSSILKDSKVMDVVADTFEELTGRTVQGIDTETKKKRKKLRSIKEKRFKKITDRRRKMMIAGIGIPKTVVNKYIKAEEEASTGLFKVLERLAKMRIISGVLTVDDSIVVNDEKDTEGDLKVRAKTVTPMVKKITLDEKGLRYNKEIEKPKYVSYFPSIESKDNEKLTTPEVLEQVWDRYIERAERLEKELKAGKPSKQIQILNYTEEQIKKKIKAIAGLQDFDPKEGKIKEKTLSKEGQKLLDKVRQELRILMKSNQLMKKEFAEQNKSRAEKNYKAISEFLKKNIKDAETGENLFDALDDFTEMLASFQNIIGQLEGERDSIYAGKDKKRIAKIAQAYTKKIERELIDANTVRKLTTVKEEFKFMTQKDVRDFKGGAYARKPKEVIVTNALKEIPTGELEETITERALKMYLDLPVSLTKDIVPLTGKEVFTIIDKLYPKLSDILIVVEDKRLLRVPKIKKDALKNIQKAIEKYLLTNKVRDRSKGIIDRYNENIKEVNKGIENLIEAFSKNKTFMDLSQLRFEYIPMIDGRQGEKELVSLYDAFDIGRQIKEEKTAEVLDPEKEGFSRMTLAAFAVDEFRDYLRELRRLEKEHEESVKAANRLEVQFIDVVDFKIEQPKTLETNLNRIDEKGQLDDKTEPLGYLERILSLYSQAMGIGKKGDK